MCEPPVIPTSLYVKEHRCQSQLLTGYFQVGTAAPRISHTLHLPRQIETLHCILIGMLPGTIDLLVAENRPKRTGPAPRDPVRTRERVLHAAFRAIYRSGFQSAGLDAILAAAGVTKGALYHHFGSKEALGYAVVEEIIAPDNRGQWLHPLENCEDPVGALIGVVQELSVQPEAVRGGCPLMNLAQEMSPLDAGFRRRLATIFRNWQDGVAAALRQGQKHATVRRDLDPAQAAGLLIAMVEGYGSLAKNAQDANVMKAGIANIVEWLRSLRPPRNRRRR